jgi:hypothetical protein
MSPRRRSCRALFLELASLGIDPTTGHVLELDVTCSEIAGLMRRIREHRNGLREVLAGEDGDLEAVRKEAGGA